MRAAVCMASTALIIGGMFLGSPYRADHTPVSVQSILCEQADIYDTVTMKGKVEAQHKCRVFPPGTATVGRIYVTQGQPIEKGEPLVTLYVTGDGTELRQAAEEGVQGLEEWLGSAAILPSGTVDTQPTAVTLTAPQTGIVMDIYCQEDELVTPLAPCVTIADLTDLVVRAQVGEEQLAEIAVGQETTMTFEAFPETEKIGRIISIAPYAKTGSFLGQEGPVQTDVLCSISNTDGTIRPGYTVTVKAKTQRQPNALLLPYSCIGQDEQGREYVMVAQDGFARRQLVKTGLELADQVEIAAGLTAQAPVLQDPSSVQPGQRIEVHNP